MEPKPITPVLVLAAAVSVCFALVAIIFQLKSKVVFCDVGQGDAVYIHTADHLDIVIDAGPGDTLLQCLGLYMPFWDKQIELAVMTHPQKDHMEGFTKILNAYTIDTFVMPQVYNQTIILNTIMQQIQDNHVHLVYADSDLHIDLGTHSSIKVLWPTSEFMRHEIPEAIYTQNLGRSRRDLNDFSVVLQFIQDADRLMFTGDATPWVLNQLSPDEVLDSKLLKVPHHGSMNGLTEQFLERVNPYVAVISCGINNKYGHPSPEIVTLLKKYGISIHRTDKEGSIVFFMPESLKN
ncbi:MAG: internalization competence protein competence protein ComEC protein [Candidatus Parcubacteria bacterium]|jgi:competence protein ComEC